MRMDAVNKTTSESFHINQLSTVGCQWEISLLQPVETMLPSELMAGQALSCFFKLKVGRRSCVFGPLVFFNAFDFDLKAFYFILFSSTNMPP